MKFKVGDKVVVTKIDFTDEEWAYIGRINNELKIGQELKIKRIDERPNGNIGLEFVKNRWLYPSVGFELKSEYKQKLKGKGMIKELNETLNKTYDNPVLRKTTVPLFMSNPGLGKSSVIAEFANKKGVKLKKITLSQRMPNEIVGGLMPEAATRTWEVYDSHELADLKDGDILFFDEIFNGTMKQSLDAVLNLLEDRMLPSGKKLADVMIVAASNYQGLINLTPQIKERFIKYDLKFDKKEYQQYLKDKYAMPETISQHLCTLIGKEKFESNDWNYMTGRSQEKAINQIGCELASPYDELLLPYLKQEQEFPEDVASLGIKKGEKVEYLTILKVIIKAYNAPKIINKEVKKKESVLA